MMESMTNHPRPTRAEVADVANAIYDGTDAVMLSGETAAGCYPIEACGTMARVAEKADEELASAPLPERYARLRASDLSRRERRGVNDLPRPHLFADAVGQAVCRMAASLPLQRIVCFTSTGYTATAIARFRPAIPITAITSNLATCRKAALIWGVDSVHADRFKDLDDMVAGVEELLLREGLSKKGDTVIIAAGSPLHVGGRTNLLKLHTLGEEDHLAGHQV
jgi:pyruvate kinase